MASWQWVNQQQKNALDFQKPIKSMICETPVCHNAIKILMSQITTNQICYKMRPIHNVTIAAIHHTWLKKHYTTLTQIWLSFYFLGWCHFLFCHNLHMRNFHQITIIIINDGACSVWEKYTNTFFPAKDYVYWLGHTN